MIVIRAIRDVEYLTGDKREMSISAKHAPLVLCGLLGLLTFVLLALPAGAESLEKRTNAAAKTALVLHGGAGTLTRKEITPEQEEEYRAKLREALMAGAEVLHRQGTSVDAVIAAIVILEDSYLFNAGKGAVFTHKGVNALDASIMAGGDLSAGAVAGVETVKNPILLADKVRTNSEHVMMTAEGAEEFAKEQNIRLVDRKYFFTERRWRSLQKALDKKVDAQTGYEEGVPDNWKFGTVGAVALDSYGQIAAGTSTGGLTNKRYGRVGDSPIIGAGTYANKLCGISATGHGEFFIRATVARDICALLEYKGLNIQNAADELILKKLVSMGGSGGVVGLDSQGNITKSFNTKGMYRASIDVEGNIEIDIFK